MNIEKLCQAKGYKLSHGINWSWVEAIPYLEAEALNAELEKNGFETRGVYPDNNRMTAAIRYR